MTVTSTPLWIEGSSNHESQQYRRLLDDLFNYKSGIMSVTDLAITQNGTPNMSVNMATGHVVIRGTEDTKQGCYLVQNDVIQNISISAAHATLPRYDMVVIRIRDNAYSTGPSNAADAFIVVGTPNSSPAEPSIPPNTYVLARVLVGAAVTTIVTANLTDRRTSTTGQGNAGLKGSFRRCLSTQRPTSLLQACTEFIFEEDTGRPFVYNGTSWLPMSATGTPVLCHVRHASGQVIGAAATTDLLFTTEISDSDGLHSTSVNTGRVTIPTGFAGVYAVTGYIQDGTGAIGQIFIRVNGLAVTRRAFVAPLGNINWTGYLAAGDYLTFSVYSGAGLTTVPDTTNNGDAPYGPSLYVVKVA